MSQNTNRGAVFRLLANQVRFASPVRQRRSLLDRSLMSKIEKPLRFPVLTPGTYAAVTRNPELHGRGKIQVLEMNIYTAEPGCHEPVIKTVSLVDGQ